MQHETRRHGLSSEILSFFVTINFQHHHPPLVTSTMSRKYKRPTKVCTYIKPY